MINNKNDGENQARFINSLNEIFCNKECCADYIRFVLNKPKDTAEDDLNENVISNIELVKKSANKNYDAIKIEKKASDAPKPEEFLNNGKFSGLPDEIKSAYLEKYFEIVDGGSFDYKKSFEDNLEDMLDRYKNYPESVFLHILRLSFGNFETDINNKKNNGNDDFSSKKSLATAIKNILDSNNFGSDEKKLALLWEYYEYFNGIDENEKLVEGQNKVEQFEDAIEKITNSDDFMKNIASDSIAYAIITGKLRAYEIDTNFKEGYVNVLSNYNDAIKMAVIESFKFVAAPHYSEAEGNNKIKINDLCYGNDNYSNLSPAVRAKMIEKLNAEVTGTFYGAVFDNFADYLMKSYQINLNEVDSEVWVALFKLFLNSNPAIGANIGQVLTTMLQIQKNTEDFTEQANLDKKILCELSYDIREKFDDDLEKNELKQDTNRDNNIYDYKGNIGNIIGNHQNEDINRDNDDNDVPFSLTTFFGKILFCLVFFVVAIPTLLIRWTLRFLLGIFGWFINMFYYNWKEADSIEEGFKNFGLEFFGFFSIGLVGAVARRWFISDPLAICQIFQNLWYRFFGNADDINNHQVYISGFIVYFNIKIG